MVGEGRACPSGERGELPETITAGGVTRWLTRHLRETAHAGISADRIQHVLENWVLRGICTDSEGNVAMTYWGFVPGRSAMLRVPVSLDDQEIITAVFDEGASRRVRQEELPWFQSRCIDLEVRNGG